MTLKHKFILATLIAAQVSLMLWLGYRDRWHQAAMGMPPGYRLVENPMGYAWVKGDRMALFICDTREQAAKDAQKDARTK